MLGDFSNYFLVDISYAQSIEVKIFAALWFRRNRARGYLFGAKWSEMVPRIDL